MEPVGDGIPPAFAELLDGVSGAVADAAGAEGSWLERIGAGLSALLAFLDAQPRCAEELAEERPLDGLLLAEGTRRVHGALAEVLDAGRGEVVVGGELTPPTALIAELLVMGVLSVIRRSLLRDPAVPLAGLQGSLMRFVVEPYVGRAAANADLAGCQPGARRPSQAEVVPIRPHPRVMRALSVMAATPGLSSREIELAESGVDRGGKHISDVLKRLEQRGVIENAGRARNLPNVWLLTPYGRRVLELNTVGSAVALPEERIPASRASGRVTTRSVSRLALVGGVRG
jgi:hypothetical protein